jgi:hypothetical protein
MPAFLNEPGNQGARRFVLRPIQPDGVDDGSSRSVIRRGSGEHHQEWEFADPWADDEGSPAALAVTRRVGDVVVLLKVSLSDGAPAGTMRLLVEQLMAVLRRTDASMVSSSVEDDSVREELLAAGFVPLPVELGADPRRIILQL